MAQMLADFIRVEFMSVTRHFSRTESRSYHFATESGYTKRGKAMVEIRGDL
jgi:hypothetical protein